MSQRRPQDWLGQCASPPTSSRSPRTARSTVPCLACTQHPHVTTSVGVSGTEGSKTPGDQREPSESMRSQQAPRRLRDGPVQPRDGPRWDQPHQGRDQGLPRQRSHLQAPARSPRAPAEEAPSGGRGSQACGGLTGGHNASGLSTPHTPCHGLPVSPGLRLHPHSLGRKRVGSPSYKPAPCKVGNKGPAPSTASSPSPALRETLPPRH